jgi:hypothetical protein
MILMSEEQRSEKRRLRAVAIPIELMFPMQSGKDRSQAFLEEEAKLIMEDLPFLKTSNLIV